MELTYLQGPEILYYSLYRPFATTTVSQLNISDIFHGKSLKILKCYNFLWLQRRHNCSPAASFANSVMELCLLKVHLKRFFLYQLLKSDKFWVVTLLSQMSYMVLSLTSSIYSHYTCGGIFLDLITPNNTPHSVGLLWTRNVLIAETCTWQHTTLTTDTHLSPQRGSNPKSQQASGSIPNPKISRPHRLPLHMRTNKRSQGRNWWKPSIHVSH